MITDQITDAVRSVLGEFVSPEKAHALADALRPIFGKEAAVLAFATEAQWPEFCTDRDAWGQGHDDHAEAADARIRRAFGVKDD